MFSPNREPAGIYMAVDYHPWSEKTINLIARDLGIIPDNGPDGEYKFHTTIVYMKFDRSLPRNERERLMNFNTYVGSTITKRIKPKLQLPIKVTGFGFFDTPDGRNLHIKVDSPFLRREFKRAMDYGIKYGYPKYEPHITLKNNVPKDFKIPQDILLKYKGSVLYTNDEYIEPLEP